MFSISVAAAATGAVLHLFMLHAQTPAQFGQALRWMHLPVWIMIVSLAWFFRSYTGTGRTWLLWLVCAMRTLALVLNFLLSPNLNFREITALRQMPLLGETVSVPMGVPNPWNLVAHASLLLFLIYVLDASSMAWRKGSGRRPLVMAGTVVVWILVAATGTLALWFQWPLPNIVGLLFLSIIVFMSYELSGDVLRATQLKGELRQSEERNRAMIAAIPDLMFLLDKDGVYLDYHAPKPEDLLLPPDQFLGRRVSDVMPPELAAQFTRSFDVVLRTGGSEVVEYTLSLHGRNRFFEAHIVRSGADQLLSIVRDVTGRKQAEEALRNIAAGVSAKIGHTFFRSLAEHMSKVLQVEYAYVCEVYDDGRRARTLASYVQGVEVENIHYPLEGSPCEQVLKLGLAVYPQGVKAEFPQDIPLQAMDVEGYLGVRLSNSTGNAGGLMSVMSRHPLTDVENAKTVLSIFAARASAELERKQAEDNLRLKEQDLRRSEERYREVVETQTDMVCRHLPDTTLTFVNNAYCRSFNRPRKDLIGRKFLELIPESARKAVLEQLDGFSRSRANATLEREVQLSDGTIGWHQWTTHLVAAADGQPLEFQAIGQDITDRKRAEDSRQQLAHASRLAVVGEFTAMIAHELNQPLAAILSNAQAAEMLLQSDEAPLDDLREIMVDIRELDLRASETIRRIRELTRRREMEMQPVSLNETVSDALRLASADLFRRRIQIHRSLSEPLPLVRADPVLLQHVMLNLFLNGMDAMNDNSESDRHLFVSTACNDGLVEVAVKDVGHGIPPADLQRIFDSFFTTKRDGMGLGLAIAHSIIQLHSGRIWAQNNADGKGAAVHFTIPTDQSPSAA